MCSIAACRMSTWNGALLSGTHCHYCLAGHALTQLPDLLVALQGIDLEESVRIDLKALRDSPLLTPASKNKLTGYIYDVKSGDLNVVPA